MKNMYHYTDCGLSNVYLQSGYHVETFEGEEYISFEDIDGLHQAIGHHLTAKKKLLTGEEFRFFRNEFNQSRRALGEMLGVDQQTIGRWEKGESPVPRWADATIRQLYLESIDESSSLSLVFEQLAEIEAEKEMNKVETEQEMNDIILSLDDHHWVSSEEEHECVAL